MKKPATLALIVGPPRSGTTLIRNVLNEHPDVAITKELHFFDGVLALRTQWQGEKKMKERIISRVQHRVCTKGSGERFSQFSKELEKARTVEEMFFVMAHFTATKETYKVLVEKTPMDALFMREIRSLFPEAVIIHTMRDGRDVVASATKKWSTRNATPLKIAALWKLFVEAYQKDAQNPHIFVKYEDMISNPDGTLSILFSHLGLSYKREFQERVGTNSSFVGRNKKGIQKSSHYKEFLTKEERMSIEYFLRRELSFFGYPLEFEKYSVPFGPKISFYISLGKYRYSFWLARMGIKWLSIK